MSASQEACPPPKTDNDVLLEIVFIVAWFSLWNNVRLAVESRPFGCPGHIQGFSAPDSSVPDPTSYVCVLFIFIVGRRGEEVVQDHDVDGWVVVLVYVEECL